LCRRTLRWTTKWSESGADCPRRGDSHRNLRTTRRMSNKNVKQVKFKVGVVSADILGCLLLISFIIMEGDILAMSAGANTTIFGPI
jgi:hypothetical protein